MANITISTGEFEELSGQIFKRTPLKLIDSDFDRISSLLDQLGKGEWSVRPRTYAVLRIIDRVDLMPTFVVDGLKDIAFPYTLNRLPSNLSPSVKANIIKAQIHVLTNAHDLEIEGSRHRHFDQSADVHFDILSVLGRGGFGEVHRVRSKLSCEEYARKRIPRKKMFTNDRTAIKVFENELLLLKKLRHHHLVQLIGSYTDPRFVCLLISPVADYDLASFLDRKPFPKNELVVLRGYFGCLASALLYLHNNCCRHKDLKPKNILIKNQEVMITDFGTSRDWSDQSHSSTLLVAGALTRLYAAPEVISRDSWNSSSDIYSLGCVFLDIITILHGQTLDERSKFFLAHGTSQKAPADNPIGLSAWFEQSRSRRTDIQPQIWAQKMLERAQTARPTAAVLVEQILAYRDDHVYYGSCCVDEDESSGTSQEGSTGEDTGVLFPSNLANSTEEQVPRKVVDISSLDSRDHSVEALDVTGKIQVVSNESESIIPKVDQQTMIPPLGKTGLTYTDLPERPLSVDSPRDAPGNSSLRAGSQSHLRTGSRERSRFQYQEAQKQIFLQNHYNNEEPVPKTITPREVMLEFNEPTMDSAVPLFGDTQSSSNMRNQRQSLRIEPSVQRTARDKEESIVDEVDQKAAGLVPSHDGFVARIKNPETFDNLIPGKTSPQLSTKSRTPLSRSGNWAHDFGHNKTPLDQHKKTLDFVEQRISYSEAAAKKQLEFWRSFHYRKKEPSSAAWFWALVQRPPDLLHYLWKNGQSLEQRDAINETAILKAYKLGLTATVQYLLTIGARTDVVDDKKNTILHNAIRSCSFNINGLHTFIGPDVDAHKYLIQLALDHGAVINAVNREGKSALFLAAENCSDAVVRFLVQNGATIDMEDQHGNTPLRAAALEGNKEIVQFLTESGANIHSPGRGGMTALHLAVKSQRVEVVEYLVGKGVKVYVPNDRGQCPSHLAVKSNNEPIVQLLLNSGNSGFLHRDINFQTPLMIAASGLNTGRILNLLILWASDPVNPEAIKYAINMGDKRGRTALHWAALSNREENVRILVEAGAILNIKDSDRSTPLDICTNARIEKYLGKQIKKKNGTKKLNFFTRRFMSE